MWDLLVLWPNWGHFMIAQATDRGSFLYGTSSPLRRRRLFIWDDKGFTEGTRWADSFSIVVPVYLVQFGRVASSPKPYANPGYLTMDTLPR